MMLGSPDRPVSKSAPSPQVFADLRMEADGHRAHLVGDGRCLVLHLDEPMGMLSTIRRMSLPGTVSATTGTHGLGRVATALQAAGLTVDVQGPDGRLLLHLGGGRGTRIGRMVTGSDAVLFGSVPDLTRTVTDPLPIGRIVGAGLAAILITIAVLAARRAR